MNIKRGVVKNSDSGFPEKLMQVTPKIKRLYYKGGWKRAIFSKTVAIVGSRKMTMYGKQVLASLIPQLVSQGFTTISGFMYGVDMEVHRLTYLHGGKTISVLGWGIDYKIDIESNDLYHNLIDSDSLFMSEYEGNMAPSKATFPQRNRIVAGLAEHVIVIEGAKRSGSLITAALALKFRRKLWAVPGPVTSEVSQGTNQLIKDGEAEMLTLDDFNLYSKIDPTDQPKYKLRVDESTIFDLFTTRGGMRVNEIIREIGWDTAKVSRVLLSLQMKGLVREENGVFVV